MSLETCPGKKTGALKRAWEKKVRSLEPREKMAIALQWGKALNLEMCAGKKAWSLEV